jgi:two-component system LytT family sensor kinase
MVGRRLVDYVNGMEPKRRSIWRNGMIAFFAWLTCMLMILFGNPFREILLLFGLFIPWSILFYTLSFYSLIPKAHKRKWPFWSYVLRAAILLTLSFVPSVMLAMLFLTDAEASATYAALNSFFQLLIMVPLSWYWYKRQVKGDEAMDVLKKELGQSTASFDFLRSQINPHFLFNALNTIYGTAIQENAERTSEGIEKLGDMMRFMLQENMQEKISLTREIDYLNNYISLQRLRTDPNPNINIETHIDQHANNIQIAPMLLIPFVENAFKHGISFREPSHIKVSLEVNDGTLNFDVHNSRHTLHDSDPEKDKSGIGLNNVKQRLQLLYRNKHELIIRETGKEFFIHLTIKLA